MKFVDLNGLKTYNTELLKVLDSKYASLANAGRPVYYIIGKQIAEIGGVGTEYTLTISDITPTTPAIAKGDKVVFYTTAKNSYTAMVTATANGSKVSATVYFSGTSDLSNYVTLDTAQNLSGKKYFHDSTGISYKVYPDAPIVVGTDETLSDSSLPVYHTAINHNGISLYVGNTPTPYYTNYKAGSIELKNNNADPTVLTLPRKTGTVALIEDLSGYLPLSGGTVKDSLRVEQGGNSPGGATVVVSDDDLMVATLYSNKLDFNDMSLHTVYGTEAITYIDNRISLPSKSGTIALLEDLKDLGGGDVLAAGNNEFTGSNTFTNGITVPGNGQGNNTVLESGKLNLYGQYYQTLIDSTTTYPYIQTTISGSSKKLYLPLVEGELIAVQGGGSMANAKGEEGQVLTSQGIGKPAIWKDSTSVDTSKFVTTDTNQLITGIKSFNKGTIEVTLNQNPDGIVVYDSSVLASTVYSSLFIKRAEAKLYIPTKDGTLVVTDTTDGVLLDLKTSSIFGDATLKIDNSDASLVSMKATVGGNPATFVFDKAIRISTASADVTINPQSIYIDRGSTFGNIFFPVDVGIMGETFATREWVQSQGYGTGSGNSVSGDYIPLSGSSNISGSLIPADDDISSLGSSTKKWHTVYVDSFIGKQTVNGSVEIDTGDSTAVILEPTYVSVTDRSGPTDTITVYNDRITHTSWGSNNATKHTDTFKFPTPSNTSETYTLATQNIVPLFVKNGISGPPHEVGESFSMSSTVFNRTPISGERFYMVLATSPYYTDARICLCEVANIQATQTTVEVKYIVADARNSGASVEIVDLRG